MIFQNIIVKDDLGISKVMKIPKGIKEAKTADDFKDRLKGWIWKNIH